MFVHSNIMAPVHGLTTDNFNNMAVILLYMHKTLT